MIKYSYALSESKVIIHVFNIERENRHDHKYYCLGCGEELIPRLGEIRKKHFAHKVEPNSTSCSLETYLHHTAKVILYESISQKISNNQPLYLNYQAETRCAACHFPGEGYKDCFVDKVKDRYNLLASFNTLYLEKRTDKFIPDLLLEKYNGDKIFIEIAVTHFSDNSKITSNNRIIEISIKSEKDLRHLSGEELNPSMLDVKCINFNIKKRKVEITKDACKYGSKYVFVVEENGKAFIMENLNNPEYYNFRRKSYPFCRDIETIECLDEAFIETAKIAFEAGIDIKSCHLCRYHGYQNHLGIKTYQIFCKFRKINIEKPNHAAVCRYYRADRNSF